MADMSRNAVYNVGAVKKLLRLHARMGLNLFMLYTEDTYEIEGEPYFGYMRGAYTAGELKELSSYAADLGIDLIPCIQTLGHLGHLLKWDEYADIKDADGVLLAEYEKTYEFIEKMIKACAECFSSRYIHIGMDEAYGVGTGEYARRFGASPPTEIILKHLKRVAEIAAKYGLRPLMWSDMFFSESSAEHNYWDTGNIIPEDVIRKKPEGCDMVFWCYHIIDTGKYDFLIGQHKRFAGECWFAGGTETYFGFAPRMALSTLAIGASLKSCKKNGVKKVICTLWGDDGAEVDYFSALLGLQMYAEHCYREEFTEEELFESFRVCTGGGAKGFMDTGLFDDVPGKEYWDTDMSNVSKCLFWQDPLYGLFDKNIEGAELKPYYEDLRGLMLDAADKNPEYAETFRQYALSAEAVGIKSELGNNLRGAYKNGDKERLAKIAENDLERLAVIYKEIHEIRKKIWFENCKPFGFEVLDIRYSGICGRVQTALERIRAYLDGETNGLPELEIIPLPYKREGIDWGGKYGRCAAYKLMASVMT
jgi:hypothetical protein